MMQPISYQEAQARSFDVIIVGAGFAAGVLVKALTGSGKSVLVIEAGNGQVVDFGEHLEHVQTFMVANAKIPNSPFPTLNNAPQPLVTDVSANFPDAQGYFVQLGPMPFESTYTRRLGGTSLHWFGSCPRMLPEDFQMQTRFGQAVDWPLSYEEIEPYYRDAERFIGVSAEVEDQRYHGISFPEDYVYPMHRIPQSYLDQWFAQTAEGMPAPDAEMPFEVRSIPQARNSVPNTDFDHGRGYEPVGAVGNPGVGKRCMGNSSCLPICPIQARYNILKAFERSQGALLTQAVAHQLQIDAETGRINGVRCKVWFDDASSEHVEICLKGQTYILASNAIENAKLLLASGACRRARSLGQNLMDHPAILSWGLAPKDIGAFRGPGLTSTVPTYRGGQFRRSRAGFVIEIGNWGWSWPFAEPNDSLTRFVDQGGLFGDALRARVGAQLPRQVRLDLMTEQLPQSTNRVSIDPKYKDRLGNYRPVISYEVDAYSQAGMVFGRQLVERLFARQGVEDFTRFSPNDPGHFSFNDQDYAWAGVGHVAGTHRMGLDPHDAVVDTYQRAHDHDNLYVVGCGSMPTLGTSNPTLTMTALTLRTAQQILQRSER